VRTTVFFRGLMQGRRLDIVLYWLIFLYLFSVCAIQNITDPTAVESAAVSSKVQTASLYTATYAERAAGK
jgi:hypothetical protein